MAFVPVQSSRLIRASAKNKGFLLVLLFATSQHINIKRGSLFRTTVLSSSDRRNTHNTTSCTLASVITKNHKHLLLHYAF
jgi:hypothetical protein